MKNIVLTQDEKRTLIHTLTGSVDRGVYRNYYAANEKHHNIEVLKTLVEKGLMIKGKHFIDTHRCFDYYHCTKKGAESVGLHLP